MTNVPKFDDNGKVISRQLVIGDTKTVCSKRTVPMPDILVEALKEYFNKQKQKQSKLGISFTDNDSFVFCNDEGNLRTYSGTKKIFYTFLTLLDTHLTSSGLKLILIFFISHITIIHSHKITRCCFT